MARFITIRSECYTREALRQQEEDERIARQLHDMGQGDGLLPPDYEDGMESVWEETTVNAELIEFIEFIEFIGPYSQNIEKSLIHFASGRSIVVRGPVAQVAKAIERGRLRADRQHAAENPLKTEDCFDIGALGPDLLKK